MFPDSLVAKNYQMKSTKLSYICNFGIAPYAKNILIKKVQETSYYAFSFDESFNAQLQKTQMDIIVRFFDDKKLKVINQYLTSEFLRHCSLRNLLYHIKNATTDFDQNKWIIDVSTVN